MTDCSRRQRSSRGAVEATKVDMIEKAYGWAQHEQVDFVTGAAVANLP